MKTYENGTRICVPSPSGALCGVVTEYSNKDNTYLISLDDSCKECHVKTEDIITVLADISIEETWPVGCEHTLVACKAGDVTYYKLIKTDDFPGLNDNPPYPSSLAREVWEKGKKFSTSQAITLISIERGKSNNFTRNQDYVNFIYSRIKASEEMCTINVSEEVWNYLVHKSRKYKITPDDYAVYKLLEEIDRNFFDY